jgi:hypothetical protein
MLATDLISGMTSPARISSGRALAQTDQPQPVGASTAVFLSLAKIGKIVESNLREASKGGSARHSIQ